MKMLKTHKLMLALLLSGYAVAPLFAAQDGGNQNNNNNPPAPQNTNNGWYTWARDGVTNNIDYVGGNLPLLSERYNKAIADNGYAKHGYRTGVVTLLGGALYSGAKLIGYVCDKLTSSSQEEAVIEEQPIQPEPAVEEVKPAPAPVIPVEGFFKKCTPEQQKAVRIQLRKMKTQVAKRATNIKGAVTKHTAAVRASGKEFAARLDALAHKMFAKKAQ